MDDLTIRPDQILGVTAFAWDKENSRLLAVIPAIRTLPTPDGCRFWLTEDEVRTTIRQWRKLLKYKGAPDGHLDH